MAAICQNMVNEIRDYYVGDLPALMQEDRLAGDRIIPALKDFEGKVLTTSLIAASVLGAFTVGSLALGLWAWSLLFTPPLLITAVVSGILTNEALQSYFALKPLYNRTVELWDNIERVVEDLGISVQELFRAYGYGEQNVNETVEEMADEQLIEIWERANQPIQEIMQAYAYQNVDETVEQMTIEQLLERVRVGHPIFGEAELRNHDRLMEVADYLREHTLLLRFLVNREYPRGD